MEDQLTIGEALAEEGIGRATAASDPAAIAAVDALIARYAATGDRFSSNDLRSQMPSGAHPNAIGGRFRQAAKNGLIRHVDWVASTKANTHGHPVKVWQGAGA